MTEAELIEIEQQYSAGYEKTYKAIPDLIAALRKAQAEVRAYGELSDVLATYLLPKGD